MHQPHPSFLRSASLLKATTMACVAMTAAPALATENGASSYAVGVETNLSGVMLPEGLHLFTYYSHYRGTHNMGANGADNPRLAYYKMQADTFAGRLSYVWPGVRVFGANVETRLALPIPTLDLTLGVARPAPLTPLDRSGSATGIGDLAFAPALLGWRHGNLHQVAGIETFVPTGNYDKTAPVSVGRNYWQVAPMYAVTWMPDRWQISGKLRFGINSRNRDTDYRSGRELTFEYSAGYAVTPNLLLGVNGYMYRQTSDDTRGGISVNNDGNRGRVNAIGPFLSYKVTAKVTLMAKLQVESGARNRPEGTRLWLQTKIPF